MAEPEVPPVDLHSIRRGLLLVWALWYSAVVATNTTDLMKTMGLLPEGFAWVSNNFALVTGAVAAEGAARVAVIAFYLGGFAWEIASTLLLWRAFSRFARANPDRAAARSALGVSLAFWGTFMLVNELSLVHNYVLHIVIFSALMLTLLVLEVPARDD